MTGVILNVGPSSVNLLPSAAASETYIIADTGQEYCYDASGTIISPQAVDSFYGQDANYVTNPMSYQDNGDGTVTDLLTGLMWQQDLGDKLTWD